MSCELQGEDSSNSRYLSTNYKSLSQTLVLNTSKYIFIECLLNAIHNGKHFTYIDLIFTTIHSIKLPVWKKMAEQEICSLSLPIPHPQNKYLAVIHEQKCLCRDFGIQVGGCETPVEGHFEKAGLCTGGWPAKCSPDYETEAASLPCALDASPTCLQYCHQPLLPRHLEVATFVHISSNRPTDLTSNYSP